jgi:hypothetical protein
MINPNFSGNLKISPNTFSKRLKTLEFRWRTFIVLFEDESEGTEK